MVPSGHSRYAIAVNIPRSHHACCAMLLLMLVLGLRAAHAAHLGCEVAKRMRSMPGTSCTWCRRSVNVHARRPEPSGAAPGRSRP